MLRNNWLTIKSLIVASSWSQIYLLRSSLFWDVTQRCLVSQLSKFRDKLSFLFWVEPVTNYKSTLRNITKERRSPRTICASVLYWRYCQQNVIRTDSHAALYPAGRIFRHQRSSTISTCAGNRKLVALFLCEKPRLLPQAVTNRTFSYSLLSDRHSVYYV